MSGKRALSRLVCILSIMAATLAAMMVVVAWGVVDSYQSQHCLADCATKTVCDLERRKGIAKTIDLQEIDSEDGYRYRIKYSVSPKIKYYLCDKDWPTSRFPDLRGDSPCKALSGNGEFISDRLAEEVSGGFKPFSYAFGYAYHPMPDAREKFNANNLVVDPPVRMGEVIQVHGEALRNFLGLPLSSHSHRKSLALFNAIDVKAPLGTPVYASHSGQVMEAIDGFRDLGCNEWGEEIANTVMILSDDLQFTSGYSHLQQGSVVVKPGQYVKVGDLIGRVGNSGQTTKPHLHFVLQVLDQQGMKALDFSFKCADGVRPPALGDVQQCVVGQR